MSHISNLKKEMEEKYGVLPKGMVEDIYKRAGEKEVNQQTGYRKKKGCSTLLERFGEFYFCYFDKLLKEGMSEQMTARSIYLYTFADYDGILRYGNAKGEGNIVKEKDLQELLGLKKTEFMNAKKELIKIHKILLIREDGAVMPNPMFFQKGKIKRKKDLKMAVRIFEEGIQEIYRKAKPKEHKKIGVLIKLLPFINYGYNVVCFNPEESDLTKVRRMTLKDICVAIEYDETNASRLKRELLKMKVDGRPVVMISLVEDKNCVFINPKVYHKGGNEKTLRYLMDIFEIFEK